MTSLALVAALMTAPAGAMEVTLTHQARLLDNVGTPLSGPTNLSIQLYDGSGDGAAPVGVEQSFPNSPVQQGYIALPLTVDTSDLATPEVWVEYRVDASALTPRQRLSHVPFAAQAAVARSIPLGPATPSDCGDDGRIVFDPNTDTLSVCADGSWRGVSGTQPVNAVNGVYRFADGTTAATCKAYRDGASGALPSGYYDIAPTGGTAFPAYCDMTTDGGGWTLCFAYDNAVYDIGNWPSLSGSRNKVLSQTWGSTDLFGPGSRQGNFCNAMPISSGSTEMAVDAREVSSGRTLDRGTFTLLQANFFTQVHSGSAQQFSCLVSQDGGARFMYANYTSSSKSWNGAALLACAVGGPGDHDTSRLLTTSENNAYGTDGYVVVSFSPSGEATATTLSFNTNWYANTSTQTLYANVGSNSYVTKFGITAAWTDNGYARTTQAPGPYLCAGTCGYTDQVQDVFGQRIWVR